MSKEVVLLIELEQDSKGLWWFKLTAFYASGTKKVIKFSDSDSMYVMLIDYLYESTKFITGRHESIQITIKKEYKY